MFVPLRHPSTRGCGAHMPIPRQTRSQGPGSSTYQLPPRLNPQAASVAPWSRRVLSSHKSNSRIYWLLMMNQRHQAEYSLNLSSRPLPRDPFLNPHLDSLSTLDWLQPLNHSPHPCAATAIPLRRLSTNIMCTLPILHCPASHTSARTK